MTIFTEAVNGPRGERRNIANLLSQTLVETIRGLNGCRKGAHVCHCLPFQAACGEELINVEEFSNLKFFQSTTRTKSGKLVVGREGVVNGKWKSFKSASSG